MHEQTEVDHELRDLDPYELMHDEATRLEAFFTGLDDDGWSRPSACEGWTVRDVLGHLAGSEDYNRACLDDDVAGLFERMAGEGVTDVHSFNAAGVAARRDHSAARVLEEWKFEVHNHIALLVALNGGMLATSVGPYPARWQAFHLAAELATHADDVGVPIPPDEEPDRTAWRARVARFMLRETHPELADVELDDTTLVRAVQGRLTDTQRADSMLAALSVMP